MVPQYKPRRHINPKCCKCDETENLQICPLDGHHFCEQHQVVRGRDAPECQCDHPDAEKSTVEVLTVCDSSRMYQVIMDSGDTTYWRVGEKNLTDYLKHLDENCGFANAMNIEKFETSKQFRFGNQGVLPALYKARIPMGVDGRLVPHRVPVGERVR